MKTGFGVAIRRKDGTEFLALTGHGVLPAAWPQRKYATAYRKELHGCGFKCRVVKVRYAEPEIVS